MKAICLGVLLVGLGAHAANIEPAPVEQPDAPRVDSPRAALVQPLERPALLDPRVVDLLGSASLKHGWSGGLKMAALTDSVAAILLFTLALPIGGAIELAVAALCLSVGIVLDMSASNDLERAKQLRVSW